MPRVQSRDHGLSQFFCTVLRLLVLALCQKVREVEKESLKQALTQLHIAKRKKERQRLSESYWLLWHELNDPELDKSKCFFFFLCMSDKLGIICVAQKFWRIRVRTSIERLTFMHRASSV